MRLGRRPTDSQEHKGTRLPGKGIEDALPHGPLVIPPWPLLDIGPEGEGCGR